MPLALGTRTSDGRDRLCHSGPDEAGAAACKQYQLSTPPVADMVGKKRYTEIQTMLDFSAPGASIIIKCPFLRNSAMRQSVSSIRERSRPSRPLCSSTCMDRQPVPVTDTAFGLRRVHTVITSCQLGTIQHWRKNVSAGRRTCIA